MNDIEYKNIAVIGANGTIGKSVIKQFTNKNSIENLFVFSRENPNYKEQIIKWHKINYEDEKSIHAASDFIDSSIKLDIIFIATGMLHDDDILPEKSLKDLSIEKFQKIFMANTILPSIIAKHFTPKLKKDSKSVFCALSAKVGSISDNKMGGWYAYRASKSALNMIIKNIAIEIGRNNQKAIIMGLHPGTVDSPLSKLFQSNIPKDKLFSGETSAKHLINIIENANQSYNGKCFSWNGEEILP